MSSHDEQRVGKGWFSSVGLPVSRRYLQPVNRNIALLWGAGGALLCGLILVGDAYLFDNRLVSNGPLSSGHASLETTCQACHTAFGEVTNDRCSACHERLSNHLGDYTFNTHYVHASGDLTRAGVRDGETPCATCHAEHVGREAPLTRVPDTLCATCHDVRSFTADHPEFDFIADGILDDANLEFTHIRHLERITERLDETTSLSDIGPQTACPTCHVPIDYGTRFAPIDFDQHCSACHLDDETSEELPIIPRPTPLVAETDDGTLVLNLGVESLETIRGRLGAGEQWAPIVSPASFEGGDDVEVVTKLELTHRDPWILHNLKRLRGAIYPNEGLAGLLDAVGGDPLREREDQYAEARATVAEYADGLRGAAEPWVQEDLSEIDRLLELVDRQLADPRTVFRDERFRLATPDPRLTPELLDEINTFAGEVAAPCLDCHTLDNARVARVQQDQRVLGRATFDHRTHSIQRDCLFCHTSIPVDDYFGEELDIPASVDHATIQNIPGITLCQGCHTSNQTSEACQTCHDFHPGRLR